MPRTDMVFTSKWDRVTVPVTIDYTELWTAYGASEENSQDTRSRRQDVIKGLFYPGDKVDNILGILKEKHLLATEPDYQFEGRPPFMYYRINEQDSRLSCDYISDTGNTVFELRLERVTNTITFDDGAGNKTTKKIVPGIRIQFPSVTRQGYDFIGWQNEAGEMVSMDDLPVSTKDETFTAIWKKIPPTFTLVFQILKRGKGTMPFIYETVRTMTVTWDSYEISVRKLLEMEDMSGYTYSDTHSGWGIDDIVPIKEDGTTEIRLRFK